MILTGLAPIAKKRAENGSVQVEGPTNVLRHFRVAGVVGPTTSSSASLSASFLSLFHVPMIGIYATSDTLSDRTIYEYFYRLVAPDSVQVGSRFRLLFEKKINSEEFSIIEYSLLINKNGKEPEPEVDVEAMFRNACAHCFFVDLT